MCRRRGKGTAAAQMRARRDAEQLARTLARDAEQWRTLATEAIDGLRYVERIAPGYDWNADPERVTALLGEIFEQFEAMQALFPRAVAESDGYLVGINPPLPDDPPLPDGAVSS